LFLVISLARSSLTKIKNQNGLESRSQRFHNRLC
jgi:hypothetical protein